MTPAELSRTVLRSVRGAVDDEELSVPVPARIVVRPPRRAGCGDYASNVALQLAKDAGRPAREVAEILRRRLAGSAGIDRVEIAGPGFLNFTLGGGARGALVREVRAAGARYGEQQRRAGEAATSAPVAGAPVSRGPVPDAPLHRGARGLVVAEALGRIVAAAGGGRPRDVAAAPEAARECAGMVARLGEDEARWALLRPAARDAVRLPERPEQREENPRFRVQYAYARTRALVRQGHDLGFAPEGGETVTSTGTPTGTGTDAAAAEPAAQELLTLLATYPAAVESAARLRAPDRLVRHLEATADALPGWCEECPPLPVGEGKPLAVHRGRLALAEATGTVLANGLRLLGISTPDYL
ncbi:ArgS-related anticodon-binding protein NrtL [Streptomyces natalensis]|uniref:arginine--tRNA ligase n=1 Tax=Streptomyces natalensis ATCC 27448 TaxID=1240678 RepID=A0A0D7CDJ5_9ACTN|nr:DALR anticodon-binding domain-containing protein [Streptomyces natalensis]KIZ14101.1 arginyl-tRNA synthetase [Streptomyces natalensis ATCC 27448]